MSPTSLANHRLSVALKKQRTYVKPAPLYLQALGLARTLSRRARVLVVVASLLLLWNLTHHTKARIGPSRSSSPATLGPTASLGPDVAFVPAQTRRVFATVYYSDGSLQEIQASRPSHGDPSLHVLWRQDVQSVSIPLGVRVLLASPDWPAELNMEQGHKCYEDRCDGARSAVVHLDTLLGLRQIRDAHASDELILEVPAAEKWSSDDVTLVTQFSVSRLPRFERTMKAYDGPLATTIYLTDEIDIVTLEKHLQDQDTLRRWETVSLAVVKPDYSIQQDALLKRLRYPINRLRNIAMTLAPTSYLFVTDADFVPSPRMHEILRSKGVPLIAHSSTSPRDFSPTLQRTAITLSAFALAPNFTGAYPSTSADLYVALHSVPPMATLTDKNAGHGPSMPSLLFPKPLLPPAMLALHKPPLILSHWSFPICYEPQWEPYYLLHRASHPLYDERFTDQGGDKQSHALLLNALGFEFRVLRNVWLVHPPKKPPVTADSDDLDEAWPSARLVDPGLEDRDEGEDHDPAHFNARAQRDERRFRYFQDFLPEMEKTWGRNVRWPRGCGARDVARGSTFGRQKTHAMFGV